METNEQPFNEQESLQLIHRMISTAKEELSDNGFFYLLWGWLVFIAALANYILLTIVNYEHHYMPWSVLMPLGGIISIIYGMRMEKKQKVKTFMDEIMKYVLISFLVSLFIVLFFMGSTAGVQAAYPAILVLYGIWLFVSGGALRFRPLVIGGIINWACAIAAFYLPFEHQLLVLAVAVLLGYIIPGHMLKANYHNAAF